MSRLSAQTIDQYCSLELPRLAYWVPLISPYRPTTHLQPCSYDLSVSAEFTIEPGEFKLVSTTEYVSLPFNLSGKVEGRSSLGRKGVFTIVASGFVDAGFQGNLTLEVFNASKETHFFFADTRIAQIVFDELDFPTYRPYQGRYQGQRGITESRL